MRKPSLFFIGLMMLFTVEISHAHKGITFQGVIKLPNNSYPNMSGVTARTMVLSPTNCILREEEFSSVNISNGYINLIIGKGTRTGSDPNLSMTEVMNNSNIFNGLVCLDINGNISGTTSYDPSSGNGERKLRLHIATLGITADFNMRSMPFAISAETLNGYSHSSFIRVSPNVTQNALESLVSNASLQSVLAGTYSAPAVSGVVDLANGGTGAATAADARTNLGLATIASSGSASDLSTGTVPTARLGTGTADNTTFLRGDGTWASVASGGGVTSVAGRDGDIVLSLTDIKDKDGNAYFDSGLECANGSTLKYDSVADKLTCVSIVINAAAITAGTVPAARLGSGTADNTTFLRGDGSWQTVTSGVSSVNGLDGDIVLRPSHLRDGTGMVAALPTQGCGASQALVYVSATDVFQCQDVKLSAADVTSGTLSIARGGTGATTALSAFDALSPLTTKGDLVTRDGNNNIRLPAGSNNFVLTANSSTTSGLEWRALTATDLPTFAGNRLIGTSAGGALQAVSCGQNQIVSFDASGNYTCTTGGGNVTNGGNSFTAAMTLGTNDNFDLNFETNGAERMKISSTGNVGLGTSATPSYLLSLGGNSARTIGMERMTTANSNGNHLTIRAGGATVSANNKAGGNMILSTGLSTGSAESGSFYFQNSRWDGGGATSDQLFETILKIGRHWSGPPQLKLGTYPDHDMPAPMVVSFDSSSTYAATSASDPGIGRADVPGFMAWNDSWTNNSYTFLQFRAANSSGNPQNAYIASITNSGGGTYTPEIAIGVSTAVDARAERLRIKADGSVGIGATNPGAKLEVTDTGTTTSAIIVPRAGNFTGTAVNGMVRYNSTSNLFEFRQNGNWVNYTTVSDARLKTNVTPVLNGLDILSQLNPVFYDWDSSNPRTHIYNGKHEVGFLAQEVEKVLPEVVHKGQDGYRSLEYGKMVSVVVAAVKELYQELTSMKEDNQRLQKENSEYRKELQDLKLRLEKIERALGSVSEK